MKEDPPLDARCRDKFLVQTVTIPPGRDIDDVTAIVSPMASGRRYHAHILKWQNVEKTAKAEIQERKIRVSFLPADGSVATPHYNNVNGTVRKLLRKLDWQRLT